MMENPPNRRYNVFYDVLLASGVLKECCLIVDAPYKFKAHLIWKETAKENYIFRCVKSGF